MRRIVLVSVVLVVSAMTIAPVAADDNGAGALIAGFNGGLGGGSAVLEHNATASGVSAVTIGQYNGDRGTVPEGRIVPFFEEPAFPRQVRCDDLAIGTWITYFDLVEFKSDFELLRFDMYLDGVPLKVESTPLKAFGRDSSDSDFVAANYGVPVIGQLPVGDYNLVTDYYFDGDLIFTFDIIFTIEDC